MGYRLLRKRELDRRDSTQSARFWWRGERFVRFLGRHGRCVGQVSDPAAALARSRLDRGLSGRRSFECSDFSNTPGVGVRSRTFITAAESRATNGVGVNLLRPVGTRSISTVFGVGAAIRRTDGSLDYTVRCEQVAPGGCPGGISERPARRGL